MLLRMHGQEGREESLDNIAHACANLAHTQTQFVCLDTTFVRNTIDIRHKGNIFLFPKFYKLSSSSWMQGRHYQHHAKLYLLEHTHLMANTCWSFNLHFRVLFPSQCIIIQKHLQYNNRCSQKSSIWTQILLKCCPGSLLCLPAHASTRAWEESTITFDKYYQYSKIMILFSISRVKENLSK